MAGSYTLAYTLTTNLTAGLRGLTGIKVGGQTILYATSADGITATNGNKLVSVIDTGSSAAFNILKTAPGNQMFEGVSFAPNTVTPSAAPAPSALLPALLGVAGMGLKLRMRRRTAK